MATKELMQDEVELNRIDVVSNFRRSMNPDRLQELAENVKKIGVLEPVLLRRGEGNRFVLIAGARRLNAAKLAGLKLIPARVLEVDENQAAEIQALENLHREDVGPVDEARAFKTLLDIGSHTVDSLAARIDKSVSYIYRSLKLLDLPEAGLKALEEGVITTGHAHQILRAPAKQAETLVKYATTKLGWYNRYPTADELKREIEKTIERDLSSALFPKDSDYGGAMACMGCPFNTGNQNALFDGAVKGKCTNPGCFSAKTTAFYKELKAKGEKKFKGLSFVGTAVENGYSQIQQIKGGVVVSPSDKKIQKVLKAKPDQFGFGILKPRRWSNAKPQLVLVCKDPEVAGIQEQPRPTEMTPEERARLTFVENHVEVVVWRTVLERFDVRKSNFVGLLKGAWEKRWERRLLAPLFTALDIEMPQGDDTELPAGIDKVGMETLTKLTLLVLGRMAGLEIEEMLGEEAKGLGKIAKTAEGEGQKLWRAQETTSSPIAEDSPKEVSNA